MRVTHQASADNLDRLRIVSRVQKNFVDRGWMTLGHKQIDALDAER